MSHFSCSRTLSRVYTARFQRPSHNNLSCSSGATDLGQFVSQCKTKGPIFFVAKYSKTPLLVPVRHAGGGAEPVHGGADGGRNLFLRRPREGDEGAATLRPPRLRLVRMRRYRHGAQHLHLHLPRHVDQVIFPCASTCIACLSCTTRKQVVKATTLHKETFLVTINERSLTADVLWWDLVISREDE